MMKKPYRSHEKIIFDILSAIRDSPEQKLIISEICRVANLCQEAANSKIEIMLSNNWINKNTITIKAHISRKPRQKNYFTLTNEGQILLKELENYEKTIEKMRVIN